MQAVADFMSGGTDQSVHICRASDRRQIDLQIEPICEVSDAEREADPEALEGDGPKAT